VTARDEAIRWATIAVMEYHSNDLEAPKPENIIQAAIDEALREAAQNARNRFHTIYNDAGLKTAQGLLIAADIVYPQCTETTIYWPDVEAIDVNCVLRTGHEGNHQDNDGDWRND
jgi:hypothetical protein